MGKKAIPALPTPARCAGAPPCARRFGDSALAPDVLADDAAHGLARAMPHLSAHRVILPAQAAVFAGASLMLATTALVCPHAAWMAAIDFTTAGFLAGTLFRGLLAILGGRTVARPAASTPADEALPVYTILVPLYREANVVPALARALLALDYPKGKLDIKFIVEADDPRTTQIARRVARFGPFEIVCVPVGKPKTKPRACNFALNFARGAFTVIFDAEDRPEPDQLRKAVAAFGARGELACLQARLNFYNAQENWLTRLFALDYALWFDVLLPGLERLGVPMPLGGTSNHFRTEVLRELGGWDPFNVTEDADLGIRIAQLGRRVAMLDATTFEEAPITFGAWLKQRSRWQKGYMQTWLVHTRAPLSLARRVGFAGFLAFHLFIGGAVASALAAPVLLLLSAVSFFAAKTAGADFSAYGLFGGYAALTLLAMIGPLKRGWRELVPYGLTVTLYWLLISIAAWWGLWQLAVDPFHWEKTAHGLSRLPRRPR